MLGASMVEIIKAFPAVVIVEVVGLLVVLVLFVPISLRIAGLSGQQIVDSLSFTLRFFVEIVREFRNENKSNL
jgi:hypothetical protein